MNESDRTTLYAILICNILLLPSHIYQILRSIIGNIALYLVFYERLIKFSCSFQRS